MAIVSLVYYDLSYPADVIAKNAAGVRIKYSPREDAYYISGVMVDRPFVDMNFDDIQGRSNGFIMKIDQSNLLQASVLAFSPSAMPAGIPELCSVNDMEISSDETSIVFTGVNTEYNFNGYVQPMVGKIDMDLNLQWCNAYEITDMRYSGIDIEYGKENSLFVLMNSETTPFAIMQLDPNGVIMQQPESYHFSIPGTGSAEYLVAAARGHILHYTESDGLTVTGNSFILKGHTYYQDLFSYNITAANNLRSGEATFDSYSRQVVPLGSQIRVTSWWAPENSIYVGGNLSLVGIYNANNSFDYGYTFIYTPGYNNDCLLTGKVAIKDVTINHQLAKYAYNTLCYIHNVIFEDEIWPVPYTIDCSGTGEKSSTIIDENEMKGIWKYAGIDEGGIHAYLNSETQGQYQVDVYDITGRKVYSSSYGVDGQKYVYLKFHTENQIYLISVNNGIKSETLKVSGVR